MAAIRKRGKKWEYTIRYKDKDGISQRKSSGGFIKKAEAVQAAAEEELKLKKGVAIDSDITLIDYYDHWIEAYKAGKHDETTERKYKTYRNKLEKYFGVILKLKKMTRSDWQKFINDQGKTRAKTTVAELNSHIRAMARSAVRDRVIDSNFTEDIELVGGPSKLEALKYLEADDFRKLKKYVFEHTSLDNIICGMIATSIMSGARLSEVIGLTWNDIDFKDMTININKSWDHKYTKKFKKTKTPSSVRVIGVDSELLSILGKLKIEQEEYFKSIEYTSLNSQIFLDRSLKPPTGKETNAELRSIEKELKIRPEITFHGLRHTHASFLILKGIDINYISHRLGHANVSITMNTYAHLLKEHEKKEAKKTILALQAL
ncbi:tyrosine-type recombinase/integrase [Xylocopilactobacillus apicola]|uniref:Site-specific integrase n=1 Tax=Xylocopilactobacillus apicola TaxID=2932184 RepID=A0AAU9D6G0_9LACO|nr:site-specific integrase [Xylocopilactobacillus apicola]BDR59128.1 site-specific integrase [Xylocopilactobacillus apicola]